MSFEDQMTWQGPPSRWIAEHGRPAEVIGYKPPGGGMPAYEDEEGRVVIMESVYAKWQGLDIRMFPIRYGTDCLMAAGGLTALHHNPGALWCWRPCIYLRSEFPEYHTAKTTIIHLGWHRMGSQKELHWRHGLNEVLCRDIRWPGAEVKAEKLIVEFLSPQQRLEWAKNRSFRCRGARLGNVYRVKAGNGFEILSKRTAQPMVSYCFHPEQWMPDADVALATKFALEDPDLEEDTLTNARLGLGRQPKGPPERPWDAVAQEMELELIA